MLSLRSTLLALLTVSGQVVEAAGQLSASAPEFPAARYSGQAIRVLLESGGAIEGRGPVTRRGGVLVFRLPDGPAVSLPEEAVAEVVPLPDGPPAPGPAGAPPVSPVQGRHGPAARHFSNDDLPPPLETGRVLVPPADWPESLPALSYEGYTDRQGRDETWWRAQVGEIRAELAEADAAVRLAAEEVKAWEAYYRNLRGNRGIGAVNDPVGYELSRAREELAAAEERLRALDAEWAAMREEARVSGALPGWLR